MSCGKTQHTCTLTGGTTVTATASKGRLLTKGYFLILTEVLIHKLVSAFTLMLPSPPITRKVCNLKR